MDKIKLYKKKRRLIQSVFTLLIILIPFFNIIRMDIPTLRFYFFNTVLWVEEFYFLFLFLMLFTWLVLTFSMIYGRVWSGWMCPQMTIIEFTGWMRSIVRKVLKIKSEKSFKKKYIETILISFFTFILSLLIGFNLVSYFVDPFQILNQILSGTLELIILAAIFCIAFIIFIDMILIREKFCKKACPYAMFQMVMTDKKTQIVRFDTNRKEECFDCKKCVSVCKMGIDIRESPYQTECIHCGDCIDACNIIFSNLPTPKKGLISFFWGEKKKSTVKKNFLSKIGLFDFKRWALITIAFIFFILLIILSQVRDQISVSISGDRSTLYIKGDKNEIINKYIVKITNRSIKKKSIDLICPEQIKYKTKKIKFPIGFNSGETKKIYLSLSHMSQKLKPGPNKILLKFISKDKKNISKKIIVFFMPEEFNDLQLFFHFYK